MSANKQDNHPIDTELALRDAMDRICMYLSAADLWSLTKVCKSWREAALHEIGKRCYIRHLHLSDKFDLWQSWKSWESVYAKSDPELSKLNIIPHTSLLIYDRRLLNRVFNMGDSRYKKMENYFKDQLSHNFIMMGIEEYLTTEDVALEDTDNQCKMKGKVIAGLFFPSLKDQALVGTAYIRKANSSPNHLIESLGLHSPDNGQSKCILLLFAIETEGFCFAEEVVESLRHRFKERKDTIWGAYFGTGLLRATRDAIYSKSSEKCVAALKIEGSKVDAWTTIIRCHWSRDVIEQKLNELKEMIVGRQFIGLVCGPCEEREPSKESCKNSNQQIIMRILKNIFPGISFVGLFARECKSWTTDGNTNTMEKDFMSIIIISYD